MNNYLAYIICSNIVDIKMFLIPTLIHFYEKIGSSLCIYEQTKSIQERVAPFVNDVMLVIFERSKSYTVNRPITRYSYNAVSILRRAKIATALL